LETNRPFVNRAIVFEDFFRLLGDFFGFFGAEKRRGATPKRPKKDFSFTAYFLESLTAGQFSQLAAVRLTPEGRRHKPRFHRPASRPNRTAEAITARRALVLCRPT
jgi:hypothetical protein